MKVLIVEDEVPLADTVRRGLTDAGFVVEVVHNDEDGVWAATEQAYEVIVLDIMLPKLNGYKVLEELRSRSVWTPPVLLLTAKDGELRPDRRIRPGRGRRPDQAVQFPDPGRPPPGTCPSWRSGAASRADRRRSDPRSGQAAGRAGRARERSDSTRVWPNVVEVYIRYLRVRLDAPFGRPIIETVRGMGYRLDLDGG